MSAQFAALVNCRLAQPCTAETFSMLLNLVDQQVDNSRGPELDTLLQLLDNICNAEARPAEYLEQRLADLKRQLSEKKRRRQIAELKRQIEKRELQARLAELKHQLELKHQRASK